MTDAQALFERGHAALDAGDFREAIECFSRAIGLQPRAAAGYRFRARAYLGLGDRPRAVADLDEAVRLLPADAQLRVERAAELLRQRRFTDAVADCDTAASLDPARADVFAIRGRCHAEGGDAGAALADFAAAAALDPDRAAELRVQRAALFIELGDPRAAESDADMAVRLDPDLAAAYETRGTARRRLGDTCGATDDYAAALGLDPSSVYARLGLGQVLYERGDAAAALATVEPLPVRPAVLELRGLCLERLGDPAGAIHEYTGLIESLPQRATGYALRGFLTARTGDHTTAVRDLLAAAERTPDDAGVWNQLAWVWATSPFLDLRRPAQAAECATRACELTGWTVPGHLDTLAAAFAAGGDFDNAVKWAEEAVRRGGEEFRERLEMYRARQAFTEVVKS